MSKKKHRMNTAVQPFYAVCEDLSTTPSTTHIRRGEAKDQMKVAGGLQAQALCGAQVVGWDLRSINPYIFAQHQSAVRTGHPSPLELTCEQCAAQYASQS